MAGPLEIPRLIVTLPKTHAHTWIAWQEDFVIKGNSSPDKEKTGTLEILSASLKDVLFTLTFRHLGLAGLSYLSESGQGIARLKASMYCEEIAFALA